MDTYQSGGVGAAVVFALGILYKVLTEINHRRIRSNCCGKLFTASIDVETTTPTEEKTNPILDGKVNPDHTDRKAIPESDRQEDGRSGIEEKGNRSE